MRWSGQGGQHRQQVVVDAVGVLERHARADADGADVGRVSGKRLERDAQQLRRHQRIAAGDQDLVDLGALLRFAEIARGVDDLALAQRLHRILAAQAPAAMRGAHGGRLEQRGAAVQALDAGQRLAVELQRDLGLVVAPALLRRDRGFHRILHVLQRDGAPFGAVHAVRKFELGHLAPQERRNEFDKVASLGASHRSPPRHEPVRRP